MSERIACEVIDQATLHLTVEADRISINFKVGTSADGSALHAELSAHRHLGQP
jgi:hypothetical protein